MKIFAIVILAAALCSVTSEAASCADGWSAYKDELCIKVFTNLLSFNEAKEFCSSQGTDRSKASLVMVKEVDMQDHLVNNTLGVFDNLWLGGKYDNQSGQYTWSDGEPLSYTNWEEGYPTNNTDTQNCIEMRPSNAKISADVVGKWADVTCLKRNLVMCQAPLPWTLDDAIEEIKRIRKQHQEDLDIVNAELADAKSKISRLEENLESVSTRVVPVGSVYVEYYNQPSPRSLWPNLTWQDVTSTYSGLFFRAYGGASGSWGSVQAECAPRITSMQKAFSYDSTRYPNPSNIAASGWSDYGLTGDSYNAGDQYYNGLRFYTESCNVRPINQAIRIWKRSG